MGSNGNGGLKLAELTYESWDDQLVKEILNNQVDYFDILKWAFKEYDDKIVYACSFGAEGMVLIDLIYKVKKTATVKFLDTGLHFPETYELIKKTKERYPQLTIESVKPNISLNEQSKWYGDELWKENPNLCCHLRKVQPLQEAIKDVDAWITGLRREQSLARRNVEYINKDNKFKKIKICPLIHWKWEDILNYIKLNHLEYNPLHDRGYPSIGCAPCTHPVEGNEDSRAGRWVGHQKTECGIHV
ncbi:phosphoadenylyl-sulfate reductase [Bacillus kwashiorkori]|uniref:phosphoadenylyl-sulfate reductase n=1 Tax=Bacillus kwashiorkori TaxID=1522318 RepID=UPI0007817346|nr:phosphoadenylyl-sulfate reductase [Bacillus kwashiorkori]